ncbi:hypothetical protein [Streptomyces sp. 8L]|uniref:hypothetical protein n=1 Tax=Streptomyces sp. 8L TaxID=2877242 RepID=UPI001CD6F56D|nr:hypothetical protein [Streptomyces sp. 8L]MCA1220202.1 hypothetical protein [Streptomyces sp. 8L]
MSESPTLRILSLGAGVQSTTLLMLAAEKRLPHLDAAIFADTGWEPRAVYDHLDRLVREVAQPAGIPVCRVASGNIRRDALDPNHRFASMPLYIRNPDGSYGMTRRQCTSEYKLKPIKKQTRKLLGYPYPRRIPRGVFVEQWVGISRDEFDRAKDSGIQYLRSAFPLLNLDGAADGRQGWTRSDCQRYLNSRGWAATPKSACIGCPFHGNAMWRHMRDERPDEWADAVEFDRSIRSGNARGNAHGKPLLGEAYLHRSCTPLDRAPVDHVTYHERVSQQTNIFDQIADAEIERGASEGCSPWACRSWQPVSKTEAA